MLFDCFTHSRFNNRFVSGTLLVGHIFAHSQPAACICYAYVTVSSAIAKRSLMLKTNLSEPVIMPGSVASKIYAAVTHSMIHHIESHENFVFSRSRAIHTEINVL